MAWLIGMESRPSASRRGYDGKWQRESAEYLKTNPWCIYCAEAGKREKATVVDHSVPHKGDWSIFWNRRNWRGLCTPHHSSSKQREERAGHVIGCNKDGTPNDPGHRWNRQ